MKLIDILDKVSYNKIVGNTDKNIDSLGFDSRTIGPNQVFFALEGTLVDGHQYIDEVCSKGVSAIVCQHLPATLHPDVTYIEVASSQESMAWMATNFYNHPSSQLRLVGITGTNGKTTTASLLYQLFRKLGYKVGLLSTINIQIDGEILETHHTTPDAIAINKVLSEMVAIGCEYCFVEVSSHAVVQHRITGLVFAGGVFSNITHDHLDYHKTFDAYIKAKKGFFDQLPATAFALVNSDDKNGRVMVQNCAGRVKTYAVRSAADYMCKVLEASFDGMLLKIDQHEVWAQFVGLFNAYNLTAVYATAIELGADKLDVLTILSESKAVSGRFESIKLTSGATAIVDYAHTPDALENVLSSIHEMANDQTKVITVVGCGGNRDKTKRPVMAQIAAKYSNTLILTSDNPRNEDPETIVAEMKAGLNAAELGHTLCIVNRHEAIKTAIMLAGDKDIVLVAGKGHENYQEIKGVKHHFDDKEELTK